MQSCDVLIVGGGPIGLEVHAALKAAGVGVVQVEAGTVGWTMGWWAPGTKYFSSPERIEIAGVPLATLNQEKATREEYLAYLRQVVGARGLGVELGWRVGSIEREGDGFVVGMERSVHGVGGPEELEFARARAGAMGEGGGGDGAPLLGPLPKGEREQRKIRAGKVVLAIGNMHKARMLGVEGETLAHVSHYLRDPHEYFGRRVLIVGGKNSAVEAAIRLYRVGAQVTMSYRGIGFDPERIKYWLTPEIEWLIQKGKIEFLPETEVESIGQTRVRLRTAGGAVETVEVDRVLLLTGYEQDRTLFERARIDLVGEERRPKFDRGTMETNVPGLFVAGTATGGTQRRTKVFIETSHVHSERIVRAITGAGGAPESEGETYSELEES